MPPQRKYTEKEIARIYLKLSKAAGHWLSFLDFARRGGPPASTIKAYFSRMKDLMAEVRKIDPDTILPTSMEATRSPRERYLRDDRKLFTIIPRLPES